MKNIIYIIALQLLYLQVASQVVLQPDTLKITYWQSFFKSNFSIDSADIGVVFHYIPDHKRGIREKDIKVWRYDTTQESREQNYRYYPINKTKSLIFITHDRQIEDDICYFDTKRLRKSWIQGNERQDSVVLLHFLDNLYCFELTDRHNMDFDTVTRYVFIDVKRGKLCKQTIDIYSAAVLKLSNIDTKKHLLTFRIVPEAPEGIPVIFNYRKMKFMMPENPKYYLGDAYYANIKKVIKFHMKTWDPFDNL